MADNTVEILVAEVEANLAKYSKTYQGMTWREKVLLLVEILGSVKNIGINTNPAAAKVDARERIRLYLIEHVGVAVAAVELQVVSGISEYGRRVRELRVEDGYKILTGHNKDPEVGINLGPSEYLLLETKPDHSAARRWHLANRIRQETEGGSSGRLLRYFQENVGEVLTSEELAYVGKATEFGRRIRELRTEQGYVIATKFTGRPDLKMGEYVLESLEQISEPHERKIPFAIQKEVYSRSENKCQICGWSREQWTRKDSRIFELHHLIEHVNRGANTAENLIAVCNRCHDDIHAGRQEIPPQLLE